MTKRHRPLIHTTVAPHTMSVITNVSQKQGYRLGATLDYIVADWVGLRRAFEARGQGVDGFVCDPLGSLMKDYGLSDEPLPDVSAAQHQNE